LLLKNLPHHWVLKLKEEEHRRQRSKFWVKMTNAPDITASDLKEALAAEGNKIKEVRTTDGGFIILSGDEDAQNALENMSGHMLGDRVIKMSRTQIKMTGDEILAWMDERLRIQDEAQECFMLNERATTRQPYYVHETGRSSPNPGVFAMASMDPVLKVSIAPTSVAEKSVAKAPSSLERGGMSPNRPAAEKGRPTEPGSVHTHPSELRPTREKGKYVSNPGQRRPPLETSFSQDVAWPENPPRQNMRVGGSWPNPDVQREVLQGPSAQWSGRGGSRLEQENGKGNLPSGHWTGKGNSMQGQWNARGDVQGT
jgi:RNA recognition motif-containing protein